MSDLKAIANTLYSNNVDFLIVNASSEQDACDVYSVWLRIAKLFNVPARKAKTINKLEDRVGSDSIVVEITRSKDVPQIDYDIFQGNIHVSTGMIIAESVTRAVNNSLSTIEKFLKQLDNKRSIATK